MKKTAYLETFEKEMQVLQYTCFMINGSVFVKKPMQFYLIGVPKATQEKNVNQCLGKH